MQFYLNIKDFPLTFPFGRLNFHPPEATFVLFRPRGKGRHRRRGRLGGGDVAAGDVAAGQLLVPEENHRWRHRAAE
jgi:hypothetical protein